jgi:hypothetical protein
MLIQLLQTQLFINLFFSYGFIRLSYKFCLVPIGFEVLILSLVIACMATYTKIFEPVERWLHSRIVTLYSSPFIISC